MRSNTKNCIVLLLSLMIVTACDSNKVVDNSTESEELSTLESSIKDYELIRDNLYRDEEGNLYHRTIDRSAADNPEKPGHGMVYSYTDYLYIDTLIDGNEAMLTPRLKDVLDAETFHKTGSDTTNTLFCDLYEDKNHKYFLVRKACGGVLHRSKRIIP